MTTSSKASVLARQEDGTIQLTLTIPKAVVDKTEEEVITEIAKTTEVPGFRPGFAPIEEVKKKVSAQTILEQILSRVLPKAYQEGVEEHKLRPILTPKFELIRADPPGGEASKENDWQIRAITCEAPKVEVGDYKNEIEAAKRANSLWIPGRDGNDKKEPTNEDKQQLVIETLLKNVKATIPQVLVEEEVNHRLAQLVDQTQKLGLTVDQYLTQTGKTAQSLREEYRRQAQEQIKIMLALQEIAQEENLEVEEDEINNITESSATQKVKVQDGQNEGAEKTQRELVKSVLLRRKALDRLTSLV